MFSATNAICETRHTRQGRQSTIDANPGKKAVRAILLIACHVGGRGLQRRSAYPGNLGIFQLISDYHAIGSLAI